MHSQGTANSLVALALSWEAQDAAFSSFTQKKTEPSLDLWLLRERGGTEEMPHWGRGNGNSSGHVQKL